MKNKIFLSICVLALILLATIIYFINYGRSIVKILTKEEKTNQLLDQSLLPKDCNLYESIDAVLKTNNISYCNCLEINLRSGCQNRFSDNLFYHQAFNQLDSSICKKLSYETGRDFCKKVVDEQISTINKFDPSMVLAVYLNTKNFDQAINILEGIIVSEQNNSTNFLLLAESYASKALAEHKEAIYIPKALTLIDKAKLIEPNNALVYKTEGYVYEIKPDLNKAMESYNKALSLDPNLIVVYVSRGHTKEMMGDTKGALADYNKAASLDIEQGNTSIYSNLCRINMYLNDNETAIKNCLIVTNSNSADPLIKSEAYQILGSFYSSLSKFDQAMAQFKMAETYSPNNVNLFLVVTDMLLKKGDAVLAEEYSQKAITLDPQRAIAYEKLAASQMLQGKNNEAIISAEKALSLVPGDVSILKNYKVDVNFRIYSILVEVCNQTGDKINYDKYKILKDSLNI